LETSTYLETTMMFHHSTANNEDNDQSSEEEEEQPSNTSPPTFQPPMPEEGTDEERKNIQDSRTNFAILHFALTVPKYSISLFLFLAAKCIPLSTPFEAVHRPLENLQTLAKMEAQSYSTCAKESFTKVLDMELDSLAQTEYARAMIAQDKNRESIELATKMTRDCSRAINLAKQSLQTWRAMNGMESIQNQTCSSEKQALLDNFLGNSSSLWMSGEITSQLHSYTEQSTHSLSLVQTYAQNRIQYDYNYFVAERIQPTLALLGNSSLMLEDVTLPLLMDEKDLNLRVEASLQDLQATLQAAKAQIDSLTARLQDYTESIEDFYRHYQDVYRRLRIGAEFVTEFLPPGLSIPQVFDLGNVPRASLLLPTFYHYPTGDFVLQTQQVLDKTKEEWIRLLEGMYAEAEHQAKHHLRGHTNDLVDQIASFLEMEGYNPPRFAGERSMAEELAHVQSLGKQVRENAEEALGPLKQLYQQHTSTRDIPTKLTSSNWNQSAHLVSDVLPTTTFEYLQPLFPSLTIPIFLRSMFSWILDNSWIVETLVQAIRLWILEAKYAKGAIPDLPVLDYEEEYLTRTFEGGDSRSLALLCKSIISVFASPGYWLAVIIVPLSVGIMVLWRPHVQQSCQESRNGTYLANHFFAPLLINGANAPGNALYLKGETECQKAKQSICNDMQVEFEATIQSDIASLSTLELNRNESVQAMQAMVSCIDLDWNALEMDEACCGLKGYGIRNCSDATNLMICPIDELAPRGEAAAFRPVVSYLEDRSCLADDFPLELDNARFNCSALSNACFDIPCASVNEDYLLAKTIETDCQIELYAFDCCSFVIVVVYQILAVSLICTLLFQGIRQLFWRKLCPDGVRFHTQLCENGEVAFGASQMDRFERMSVTIQRYERNGKFKLILGIFTLIWWAMSLVVFRHYEVF